MIMVGAMAAVIWGIGVVMGKPRNARWIMIGILLVAVIALQLVLPDGHPLREATGGDARLWLLVVAFSGIVWAYRILLRRLKARVVQPDVAVQQQGDFTATELDRYARHIVLREIGGPGQKSLKNAKVFVIGAGGLGSPTLQYLAAAGVGTIGVIDDDTVENTNLQRQVIHRDESIGAPKVTSAAEAMVAQNPYTDVRAYERRLTGDIAEELFVEYDVILDGSDNFDTRYLVNETATRLEKPLIAAALTQWEGQISFYDPSNGGPCYACVFPTPADPSLVPSCAEAGVLGPLPGVVGSMMAAEAIKVITGAGEPLRGRLMIYDALYADTRTIQTKIDPDCAVCGGKGAA
ncbi:HesA/MoeB/ThiF family protein [Cognatiyoonia sp.]|uniref:HesA/MoeB/ThiF family protein n=1 Tax=Cognatiyoonia sp. TaxID=2211652 RepID=UPI003F69E55A